MAEDVPRVATVVIADDHPLFRMGLKYALQAQAFDVVAEAADGQAAVRSCQALSPDVVLLDIKMPELDGLEACKVIKKQSPESLVVMLSTFDEPAIIEAARAAGATAYVSKETVPAELAQLLRAILAKPHHDWLPQVNVPTLTAREAEVLALLAQGCTNKAIAKRLGVSPETVKDHLGGVYRKLNVRDRLSAVGEARRLGLLRPG